jgi:peptidoglycan L-alanyl-D-glutamate endopeptidase CwlK
MYQLSPESLKKLENVHPDLQRLVQAVADKGFPILVVEGFRDEASQMKAFSSGHSKKKWPDSKHNSSPSLAVDLSPVPYDSSADKQLYFFCGFVLGIAREMNLPVRWGGDWKGAYNVYLNSFPDLYHFELIV